MDSTTSPATKADYVRGARKTRKERRHTCHWPGCEALVDPSLWGCKPHWMSLPRKIRQAIWAAYRPGQEISKMPSPVYIAAALEARRWIHEFQASQRGQGHRQRA